MKYRLLLLVLLCAPLACRGAGMPRPTTPYASPLDTGSAPNPLRLTPQECRRLAVEHSQQLRQAEGRLRQAQLDEQIARTAYLPSLDGTAMGIAMTNMDMMGQTLQMRGAYMAGLNLTQPLYAGGKIRTGSRLAAVGIRAEQEQQRLTRSEVLLSADQSYWTYVSVRSKVEMLGALCLQMDTLLRQTQVAVGVGMAAENDLLRIEAKRSEVRYQRQKAETGAELCRLDLCRTIGADYDTQIEPDSASGDEAGACRGAGMPRPTTPYASPVDTKDTSLIALRPELSLLREQVEAGRLQQRMARADLLPTVALSAGYTRYGNIRVKGLASDGMGGAVPFTQKMDDGIGMAMLSVSIPLLRWGATQKKVRKARIETDNARWELERNTQLMEIEARQAALNLRDAETLVETARTGQRQAEENLRVMRTRHEARMSPLTDLLDAQSQWQQARSNLIEAQTQRHIRQSEWLKATGQLE